MRPRMKPNSVSLAEGKPASISLKPHLRRRSKKRLFCSIVIGFTSAWLPSRRSDEAHRGALVMRLSGHVRFLSGTLSNGLHKSASMSDKGEPTGARAILHIFDRRVLEPALVRHGADRLLGERPFGGEGSNGTAEHG